jgi:hypothetical protein
MLGMGPKPTVTLLREELSACLAERAANPAIAVEEPGFVDNPVAGAGVDSVFAYLRGKGDISSLSPPDLISFALFCQLDFHRILALVVKGEWEWYLSRRLPAGKSIEYLVNEGLSAVRDLSSGFNPAMDKGSADVALYRLFENHGGLASGKGYDEKDLRDIVRHMILADVQMFAGQSPELANFIAAEEAQRALLKGASTDAAEEFWKKKRIWIELENEVEGLLLKLEEQTLRNRKSQRQWMSVFGHVYIPLLESEYLYTSLTYRIDCKSDDPGLTMEELDALDEESRQAEKEHLAKLKKNAIAVRKVLPGSGGIPLDHEEMEEYEQECKKLLRKIWRLTHPDRIEQEKFTPEQKKKLRAYFEEAVPYQEGGSLDDEEIALSMRSLAALKELLAKVEAVWKSMGLDCNEQSMIQGETLEQQCVWLDTRIRELEEEAGQVRVELMAAANDPEFREMDACLSSPEQIAVISEEMNAKLDWYNEQNQLLEQRLAALFREQEG